MVCRKSVHSFAGVLERFCTTATKHSDYVRKQLRETSPKERGNGTDLRHTTLGPPPEHVWDWGVLIVDCEPLLDYASPRLEYFSRYRGKTSQGYHLLRHYLDAYGCLWKKANSGLTKWGGITLRHFLNQKPVSNGEINRSSVYRKGRGHVRKRPPKGQNHRGPSRVFPRDIGSS